MEPPEKLQKFTSSRMRSAVSKGVKWCQQWQSRAVTQSSNSWSEPRGLGDIADTSD